MNEECSKRALVFFAMNYNCAQSVFAACASSEGLTEEQRLALAAPFGGGVARLGEICGALSGALLALGEAGGAEMAADPAAGRNALYERARQLTEAFRKANGSILCRELTGCALDTAEGQSTYKDLDLHRKLCSNLVTFAAGEAGSLIETTSKQK